MVEKREYQAFRNGRVYRPYWVIQSLERSGNRESLLVDSRRGTYIYHISGATVKIREQERRIPICIFGSRRAIKNAVSVLEKNEIELEEIHQDGRKKP